MGEGDAAALGGGLRRNDNLESGGQRAVAPPEFGAVFKKGSLIRIGLDAARLVTRGPAFARLRVTKKNIAAPLVACDILAPARDCNVAPTAIAGARRGQHHGVPAIRKQMRPRNCTMRSGKPAQNRRDEFPD